MNPANTQAGASSDAQSFFVEQAPPPVDEAVVVSQRGIIVPLRQGPGGNTVTQALIPQLEVFLRLPTLGFKKVDPLDPQHQATLATLVKAAKQCRVTVEFNHAQPGFATILGWSKADISRAIKAVHFILGGADSCHPRYIVEASVDKRSEIMLAFEPLPQGGHRPTLSSQEPAAVNIEGAAKAIQTDLADQFAREFQELASYLRRAPEALRMRVHFGVAQFKQLRSGNANQTFTDFEKFARQVARRGTGDFDPNFGGPELAGRLRGNILFEHRHTFQPSSTQGAALGENTAAYMLIFLIKGLRVEIPLNVEQRPARGPATALRRRRPAPGLIDSQAAMIEYNVGSYRAFRRETRLRSCEVIACCPHKNQDWQLEVLKEVDLSEVPFTVEELRRALHIRSDPSSSEQPPTPQVTRNFASGKIDDTVLKVSWEFDMRNSPNITVEVSQYRRWAGINTSVEPVSGSGVCLHSKTWAYELKRSFSATEPRNWRADCSNLFSSRETGAHAHLSFVEQIGVVHDVVEAASRVKAVAGE